MLILEKLQMSLLLKQDSCLASQSGGVLKSMLTLNEAIIDVKEG